MADYFYDKYRMKNFTPLYEPSNSEVMYDGSKVLNPTSIATSYDYAVTGYEFNSHTGVYTVTSYVNVPSDRMPKGTYVIRSNASGGGGITTSSIHIGREFRSFFEVEKFTGISYGVAQYSGKLYSAKLNNYPTRGEIEESNIVASATAYPENGMHTDGYWYIRKEPAYRQQSEFKINGQIKTIDSSFCKINGQIREIEKVWTKVNGQLKEV